MALADDARWGELTDFARGHVRALPWDPAGWMALGLALHRGQKTAAAAAAFDSGMVLMSPAERSRYDRIERVLRPLDSSRTAASAAAARAAYARTYWLLADRLWSRDGNEERLEFLARVEFAELRWTVDELGVRGADTDRGDTYIRYGPPDIVVALQPTINGGNVIENHDIATYWLYKSGLMFSFS